MSAARRLSRTVLAKMEREAHDPRPWIDRGAQGGRVSGIVAPAAVMTRPPYWARNTSSRFGSRLTTSTRPCGAAAAMTAPIGPLTRIVTIVLDADVADPSIDSKTAAATGCAKVSST